MGISFSEILNFLGSLGLFLVGMKVMSDSLMDLAGNRMRRVMAGLTSNRFLAASTGLFITGLIQSSSATTLMVVSFVNAGLLQLTEALGVIMGANIGTTLTAWLIAILGFKISMMDIALPLMIVGFLFYIRESKQASTTGGFIIGFALLFIGLEFMKDAVPDLQSNPAVFELLSKLNGFGFWSLILFALLGTILTLVLQSSSATMAITLIAVSQGWLPFEPACAIILGENIGTTITANLAALVASINARRAALAHMVFNIIGVIWVLALFGPFLDVVTAIATALQGASPLSNPADAPIGLAIFHTVFNVINTLIMIGFIGPLAWLVTRIMPDRKETELLVAGTIYLDEDALKYPQTAIYAAVRETRRLFDEPVKETLLQGINIPNQVLDASTDIDKLVKSSRGVISPNFEDVAVNRLQPVYRELLAFRTKTHQRFTLEDDESRQLSNVGDAARDAVLILGNVIQLNREMNLHMNDENSNVLESFDKQRAALLEFLVKLGEINIKASRKELETFFDDMDVDLKSNEREATEEIERKLEEDRIAAEMGASLFSVIVLNRSICHQLIRATRHFSDAAASYDEVEIEVKDQLDDDPAEVDA